MFVRQVKRKCSVRGCKNTDCFAISRSREVGNTVIICKSCLGTALGAIDEIDPETKSNIPAIDNTDIPSLFFNSQGAAAPAVTSEPPADDDEQDGNAPTSGNSGENDAENNNDADLDNGNNPPADGTDDTESDADSFICPHCGDKFGSEKGLKTHLRYCKQQNKE